MTAKLSIFFISSLLFVIFFLGQSRINQKTYRMILFCPAAQQNQLTDQQYNL